MWTESFWMFKLDLEKAEEPESKLPTSAGSLKKQGNSRKTSISVSLTLLKPLTMDHNKLWKILKEIWIPEHLTCLLRNLYAGKEATVRTRHGTTAWVKIGKGVWQGCILSPCQFNLYEKECMYLYNWITALQKKLTQHCKSTILKWSFKEKRRKS